jgi:hypothetical protein
MHVLGAAPHVAGLLVAASATVPTFEGEGEGASFEHAVARRSRNRRNQKRVIDV